MDKKEPKKTKKRLKLRIKVLAKLEGKNMFIILATKKA